MVLVWALVMLAGCQIGGRQGAEPSASGAAGAITVTTLNPPVAEGEVAAPLGANDAKIAPHETVVPATAVPAVGPTDTVQAGSADVTPPVIAEKPPLQIACEKRGGRWATAGTAGSKACVSPTRDGGQQCTRETDCEGLCLARSGSCAPVKPMFGCNEILQADGRRVTLCID